MFKKESDKICFVCRKPIDTKKEKYVLLGTYNLLSKPNEELYFHFPCHTEWFNTCVRNQVKAKVQGMQKMAIQVSNHPMIKEALSHIGGGDQVLNMLNLDLDDPNVNKGKPDLYIKKVEEKIRDDKRKKRKKE